MCSAQVQCDFEALEAAMHGIKSGLIGVRKLIKIESGRGDGDLLEEVVHTPLCLDSAPPK